MSRDTEIREIEALQDQYETAKFGKTRGEDVVTFIEKDGQHPGGKFINMPQDQLIKAMRGRSHLLNLVNRALLFHQFIETRPKAGFYIGKQNIWVYIGATIEDVRAFYARMLDAWV